MPDAHITRTCWLARYRHHIRCRLVHRIDWRWNQHMFTARVALVWCAVVVYVIPFVRLSVCHKSVLGPVSKLVNVKSRKQRCIEAQLKNVGFGSKDLNEIQTRSLLTGTPNAGGLQEIVYTSCVIISVSQKRHKFGFLLPSRTNRFPSFWVV